MTGLMGQRMGKIHNLAQIGSQDEVWGLPEKKKPSRMIPLLLVLPMFAQIFHYMIDINSLYLLSKAWAVLMLPTTWLRRSPFTHRVRSRTPTRR